jgi:hypothetical protein
MIFIAPIAIELLMDTKLQPNPCHWTQPQLLARMETKHVVLDVLARSLLQKKWWQPLAITIDIVSDVAFVVNHWILHLFVMVLMTRFTAGCVMDVLGEALNQDFWINQL